MVEGEGIPKYVVRVFACCYNTINCAFFDHMNVLL